MPGEKNIRTVRQGGESSTTSNTVFKRDEANQYIQRLIDVPVSPIHPRVPESEVKPEPEVANFPRTFFVPAFNFPEASFAPQTKQHTTSVNTYQRNNHYTKKPAKQAKTSSCVACILVWTPFYSLAVPAFVSEFHYSNGHPLLAAPPGHNSQRVSQWNHLLGHSLVQALSACHLLKPFFVSRSRPEHVVGIQPLSSNGRILQVARYQHHPTRLR